jgi:hypothetical protein
LGPPKVMKNGFYSATTLSGSATLPFVISTEAKRSGEISVWMLLLGNVLRQSVSFSGTRATDIDDFSTRTCRHAYL